MSQGPYDHLGMSDDQLRREHQAQDLVNEAKKMLIKASTLTNIMPEDIMDGLDALPNHPDWDERIQAARRVETCR